MGEKIKIYIRSKNKIYIYFNEEIYFFENQELEMALESFFEENKVYGELKVIFARKILDEEILFCEKIVFKRVSPLEVEMRVVESEFL